MPSFSKQKPHILGLFGCPLLAQFSEIFACVPSCPCILCEQNVTSWRVSSDSFQVQFFQELVRLRQYIQFQQVNISMQTVSVSDIIASLMYASKHGTACADGMTLTSESGNTSFGGSVRFPGNNLASIPEMLEEQPSAQDLLSPPEEIIQRLLALCSEIGKIHFSCHPIGNVFANHFASYCLLEGRHLMSFM